MQNFSTFDVHPRERTEYWRAVASKTFLELDCVPFDRARFQASLEATSLGGIGLATVATEACMVRRDAKAIGRAASDDLLFSVQLSGTTRLEQGGTRVFLKPGDCHLYDGSRPYLIEVLEPGRQMVAKVERKRLESRVGRIETCAFSTIGCTGVAFDIAARFWSLLPERADAMRAMLASKIADQALDLLSVAMQEQQGELGAGSAATLGVIRLREIIEARLSDPKLTCASVAAAAGISRRYASKLFQLHGISMREYIMHRRLQRCRESIEVAGTRRRFGEIAYGWGLADLPHFSKSFKSHFGLTPSAFRRKCIYAEGNAAGGRRKAQAAARTSSF